MDNWPADSGDFVKIICSGVTCVKSLQRDCPHRAFEGRTEKAAACSGPTGLSTARVAPVGRRLNNPRARNSNPTERPWGLVVRRQSGAGVAVHREGSSLAIARRAPGVKRAISFETRASGVTGTTASLRTTARMIASATFSGG